MRKLKLQVQISLDGFIASANGEMNWLTWNWDDGLKEYVTNLTAPVDTILLGRVLAQGFIPTWTARLADPATADDAARKFVETPKVVFSRTLTASEWYQTELAKGDLVEAVNRLKSQTGGDIIAYGGGRFVSDLVKNGLIDEYHLFVNPVALGSGMPIFQTLGSPAKMKLMHTRSFDCGIAVLCYAPDREAAQ